MKRALVFIPLVAACGGTTGGDDANALDLSLLPYASELVRFAPGEGAGYGADRLPNVVLGPPSARSEKVGSLDVASLGKGGEIVLAFRHRPIVDGPGSDFVVFENAFIIEGESHTVFSEPGEVSVSEDGDTWRVFPCESDNADARWPGCAGIHPTRAYDVATMDPLDPAKTGGDGFDLATVGLARAVFVRVRDRGSDDTMPTAGFDLDAVGVVNYASVASE